MYFFLSIHSNNDKRVLKIINNKNKYGTLIFSKYINKVKLN